VRSSVGTLVGVTVTVAVRVAPGAIDRFEVDRTGETALVGEPSKEALVSSENELDSQALLSLLLTVTV
jgi:hypothetical protein